MRFYKTLFVYIPRSHNRNGLTPSPVIVFGLGPLMFAILATNEGLYLNPLAALLPIFLPVIPPKSKGAAIGMKGITAAAAAKGIIGAAANSEVLEVLAAIVTGLEANKLIGFVLVTGTCAVAVPKNKACFVLDIVACLLPVKATAPTAGINKTPVGSP